MAAMMILMLALLVMGAHHGPEHQGSVGENRNRDQFGNPIYPFTGS